MSRGKMTAVQSTMRECWLKALREGQLIIRFRKEGEARQIRTLLYSLRKSVQMGQWADDTELCEAVDNCIIRCDWMTTEAKRAREENPGTASCPFALVIEHASRNSMFQSVFEALGEAAGSTPEQSSAAASARRVQELIEEAENIAHAAPKDTSPLTAEVRIDGPDVKPYF